MPKLNPKKVKDFPLVQQKKIEILLFLVGQPGQGRTSTKAGGDSHGLFSSFYRCLAKGKAKSSTPFLS